MKKLAVVLFLLIAQAAGAQVVTDPALFPAVLRGITAVTGTGTTVVLSAGPTLSGTVTFSSGATMVLPLTTFASQGGILYKGATPWIHDFNYGNNGTVTMDGFNVFLGGAGNFTMGSSAGFVQAASRNIGIGSGVLASNTIGWDNTGVGYQALLVNTTGAYNAVLGRSALAANTTGSQNAAVGRWALLSNTTGDQNTAIGTNSIYSNTMGAANVGIGVESATHLLSGSYNTAIGSYAMGGVSTGSNNTVIGARVTSLPASISNNIVVADGSGQQRVRAFPSLALTEGGGAETVLTLTSTTTNSFTVDVDYMVKATDATPDYAVRKGSVGLVCVNNATAVTCTASATDQTNDGRNGGGSLLINTNAKTLTYAIAVDVATANVAKITFNIDSDMTVTAAGITMVVTVNGIVTPS